LKFLTAKLTWNSIPSRNFFYSLTLR